MFDYINLEEVEKVAFADIEISSEDIMQASQEELTAKEQDTLADAIYDFLDIDKAVEKENKVIYANFANNSLAENQMAR